MVSTCPGPVSRRPASVLGGSGGGPLPVCAACDAEVQEGACGVARCSSMSSSDEKAARLGRRIAEAAKDIYHEDDPATLVALGVLGLKSLAADAMKTLDERERVVVERMVGSAQGRSEALRGRFWDAETPAAARGRRESDRKDSVVSNLAFDSRASVGSIGEIMMACRFV